MRITGWQMKGELDCCTTPWLTDGGPAQEGFVNITVSVCCVRVCVCGASCACTCVCVCDSRRCLWGCVLCLVSVGSGWVKERRCDKFAMHVPVTPAAWHEHRAVTDWRPEPPTASQPHHMMLHTFCCGSACRPHDLIIPEIIAVYSSFASDYLFISLSNI